MHLSVDCQHDLCDPQEKHELEEQRQALAEEVVKYRLKIKQLENDLLFRLSNSSVRVISSCRAVLCPVCHAAVQTSLQTAGFKGQHLLADILCQ